MVEVMIKLIARLSGMLSVSQTTETTPFVSQEQKEREQWSSCNYADCTDETTDA